MSRLTLNSSARQPRSLHSTDSATLRTSAPTILSTASGTPGPTRQVPTLAQRLLSPSPSTPLPPIIPARTPPELSSEVELLNSQIYHFLALALRAFVLPWWSKISGKDKDFLPQITSVVRHVADDIYSRVAGDEVFQPADLVGLLTGHIPHLIQQHYADYRHAERILGTSCAGVSPNSSLPYIFHRLQSHVALSPSLTPEPTSRSVGETVGTTAGEAPAPPLIDPTYLRVSIDAVLKASLPLEDSRSELERSIVKEIVVGPVLGGALPKLAQPWFIHQILLNVLGPPKQARVETSNPGTPRTSRSSTQGLLVIILTTIQTISTLCLNLIHMSQQLYHLAQTVNSNQSNSKGSRSRTSSRETVQTTNARHSEQPLLMIKEILDLRDDPRSNAPTVAFLNLCELLCGIFDPFLDKLIPYLVHKHILIPSVLSKIVTTSTKTLFPESNNGYPGPPPIIPTPEEQVELRKDVESRLKELIPSIILTPDLPSRILDPLSSPECNAHLIMLLYDLVIVTLYPEIGLGGSRKLRDSVLEVGGHRLLLGDDSDDTKVNE